MALEPREDKDQTQNQSYQNNDNQVPEKTDNKRIFSAT